MIQSNDGMIKKIFFLGRDICKSADKRIADDFTLAYIFMCILLGEEFNKILKNAVSADSNISKIEFYKWSKILFEQAEAIYPDCRGGYFEYLNDAGASNCVISLSQVALNEYAFQMAGFVFSGVTDKREFFEEALSFYKEANVVYQKDSGHYTSDYIAQLMARIVGNVRVKSIYDFAIGLGDLERAYLGSADNADISIVGYDANIRNVCISRMLFKLLGVRNAVIEVNDPFSIENRLGNTKFDLLLSNPPFSKYLAKEYKYSYESHYEHDVGPVFIYLQKAYASLNETGRAVLVMPPSALTETGKPAAIREAVSRDDVVEAIVKLPQGLFHGTKISAAILVINKKKLHSGIYFLDVEKYLKKNKMVFDDSVIDFIEHSISKRVLSEYANVVEIDELEKNNFLWMPDRYLNVSEQVRMAPNVHKRRIEVLNKEMLEIDKYLANIEKRILGVVK